MYTSTLFLKLVVLRRLEGSNTGNCTATTRSQEMKSIHVELPNDLGSQLEALGLTDE